MRTIFTLISALVFAFSLNSQTKLIAHKSHHGDLAGFSAVQYDDNLGLSYFAIFTIDTVIKISNHAFVQINTRHMGHFIGHPTDTLVKTDTINYHPFLTEGKMPFSKFKEQFTENAVFIGFDPIKTNNHSMSEEEKNTSPLIIKLRNNQPLAILLLSICLLIMISTITIWNQKQSDIIS